jgi:predicted Zn-dependent peptidase
MDLVQQQVLEELSKCCGGEITQTELLSAKQALLSSLRTTHDSPGAIENYYATAALSGLALTPEGYMAQVEQVSLEQVAQAACAVKLHTVFSLKGVGA